MSSFWGHSWRDKDERGLRDHHRLQEASYRKASLPCPTHQKRASDPITDDCWEVNSGPLPGKVVSALNC
ncbi:rCG52978 [Rattus norvegicus]|uniref:RCG52978 n=1 Tax=Rattus norvegicus TaxID=10116 RepID=A6IQN7_RAT|nr:rCG52978 [Rattus norvegicus]